MANEACREKLLSDDYFDLIVDYPKPLSLIFTEDYCNYSITDTIQVVSVSREGIPELNLLEYSYGSIPKLYTLVVDGVSDFTRSLNSSGILQVQGPPLELTGRNVVLCFMDTGIDYADPAFRFSDGTTKLLAIWDQTLQTGEPPQGFVYGTEFGRDQINEALRSERPYDVVGTRDENGHGTMMARLAAAAAPAASIVMVKLKEAKQNLKDYYLIRDGSIAYQETDLLFALKYLQSFGKPLLQGNVICIGLGTNMGDHNNSSLLNQYLNQLGNRRSMAVVIAAGNEGNARHHYYGVFDSAGARTELDVYGEFQDSGGYQEVEISVGEGEKGFTMELWAVRPSILTVSVQSPGGEMVPRIPIQRGSSSSEYNFIYGNSRLRIEYSLVQGESGAELVFFRFQNPVPGIWRVGVYQNQGVGTGGAGGPVTGGVFHVWLPVTGFIGEDTYFLTPSPDVTITEPSTAENPMGIAAYNDVNDSLYINSGRGYTMSGRIKPDFAAPGVNIDGATGSCLAAAITAGAAAQFLEWSVTRANNPAVRQTEVKNYFIRGAARKADLLYPNREWGYGSLNLRGVFDSLTIQ